MPRRPGKRGRLCGLLLAAVFITISCQTGALFSVTGKQARADNRFQLEEGGPHLAHWESADLMLDYEYDKSPDQLIMRGHVTLQNKNAKFPSVKQLRVMIHFLDAEGFILGSGTVWNPGRWVPMTLVNWNFERAWPLPQGATKIAFSYDGTVGEQGQRHGDDGGGVDWDFWRGP
jgi:hypothetical protein